MTTADVNIVVSIKTQDFGQVLGFDGRFDLLPINLAEVNWREPRMMSDLAGDAESLIWIMNQDLHHDINKVWSVALVKINGLSRHHLLLDISSSLVHVSLVGVEWNCSSS